MRSSTSSDWPMHRTGMAAMVAVLRISRHSSAADRGPVTTSRITRWLSGVLLNASSASAVVVTV